MNEPDIEIIYNNFNQALMVEGSNNEKPKEQDTHPSVMIEEKSQRL